jgi:hypothetical protein
MGGNYCYPDESDDGICECFGDLTQEEACVDRCETVCGFDCGDCPGGQFSLLECNVHKRCEFTILNPVE